MFHSERSFKDFLFGVLVGGSLGAVLFNTKQGKKVQAELLHKYHKMSHTARDIIKKEMKKRVTGPLSKRKKKKR